MNSHSTLQRLFTVIISGSLCIQESKPQEAGKDKARTLIIGFRDICRRKIEQKEFGPCEFEASKSL